MKTCSKCKVEKEITEFTVASNRKDGHHVWCKECCYIYRRGKSYDRTDSRREYLREWQRRYRASAKAREYEKEYRNKYHRSFSGLCSKLLSSAKKRAKDSGIDYDLDGVWIVNHLGPLLCEATGMPLSLDVESTMQHTYNRPSIDRVDSSKGYTKDNCQIVSVIYNKAKSDGSHEHVLEMCKCLMNKSDT